MHSVECTIFGLFNILAHVLKMCLFELILLPLLNRSISSLICVRNAVVTISVNQTLVVLYCYQML